MNQTNTEYFKEKFDELQEKNPDNPLQLWRKQDIERFRKLGIPTLKHEEWKYTGIGRLFNKNYAISPVEQMDKKVISRAAIANLENANHLVFINGIYSKENSHIVDQEAIDVLPLDMASTGKYKGLVAENFNKSKHLIDDGIHALNTSLMEGGIFVLIKKNQELKQPVYFNQIFDTTQNHVLASPRSLVIVEENAKAELVESYHTEGTMDSFSNEVKEIVVKENAVVDFYKLQNDSANANHVGTTHIRQVGKSLVYTVVVSLDGGMIRNNTDVVMESEGDEAHLYGLYLLKGRTHVDNHSIVDNTKPHALSNELYKGIVDDYSTAVFNGKIFVRQDAQKIDAYQTNNNIMLSETATVNTKPQLEIWADDVKCSHGCTVGQLDEDALFYCQARGIGRELAKSLLLRAFSSEILDKIKIESLKDYIEGLIANRLGLEEEGSSKEK